MAMANAALHEGHLQLTNQGSWNKESEVYYGIMVVLTMKLIIRFIVMQMTVIPCNIIPVMTPLHLNPAESKRKSSLVSSKTSSRRHPALGGGSEP
jgi:hypothetical protein